MARRRAHAPLNIFLNGRLVGVLAREANGAIDYHYHTDCWHGLIPSAAALYLLIDHYRQCQVIAKLSWLTGPAECEAFWLSPLCTRQGRLGVSRKLGCRGWWGRAVGCVASDAQAQKQMSGSVGGVAGELPRGGIDGLSAPAIKRIVSSSGLLDQRRRESAAPVHEVLRPEAIFALVTHGTNLSYTSMV